jgi:hypothetical protein
VTAPRLDLVEGDIERTRMSELEAREVADLGHPWKAVTPVSVGTNT